MMNEKRLKRPFYTHFNERRHDEKNACLWLQVSMYNGALEYQKKLTKHNGIVCEFVVKMRYWNNSTKSDFMWMLAEKPGVTVLLGIGVLYRKSI